MWEKIGQMIKATKSSKRCIAAWTILPRVLWSTLSPLWEDQQPWFCCRQIMVCAALHGFCFFMFPLEGKLEFH